MWQDQKLRNEALQVIGQLEVSDKVNWEEVYTMKRAKSGIGEEITL